MTLDGQFQAKGFSYWKDVRPFGTSSLKYKAEKEYKEFEEIALQELNKDADIFLIDEIGERFFFSNDIQDRLVSLVEDPEKLVVMSSEDYFPGLTGISIEEYSYFDHLRQYKHKQEHVTSSFKETAKI